MPRLATSWPLRYDLGQGVEQNFDDAFQWFCQAAERGHLEAAYQLGQSYSYGIYAAQDYDQAIRWFRQAAEGGHADAQYMLVCPTCTASRSTR